MSNITLGAHVVGLLLALLQCCVSIVLGYRLFLLSRTYKGVDPHRRATTVNMLKAHRVCVFIMTALQCVRCIDAYTAQGIWSYTTLRFLQLCVTICIYFLYSTTSFILMDTLYACALKRTPGWLATVLCILPASYFVMGFGGLVFEYLVAKQWGAAILSFYLCLMFLLNLITYNGSGVCLIRILLNHQRTGISAAGEDLTAGSKSASPFDIVISKTRRSMFMLSVPSFAALIFYFAIGVGNCNTRPLIPFNPEALTWPQYVGLFLQIFLGFIFTRVCWISKTALNAEIMGKGMSSPGSGNSVNSSEGPQGPPSQGSPEQPKRTGRTASRADLKERAKRLSQSPKPRNSALLDGRSSAQHSQAEPESAAVAVTVNETAVAVNETAVAVNETAVAVAVAVTVNDSRQVQGSSEGLEIQPSLEIV